MAKTDIQEAFRLVPMSPSVYYLLGFQFKNQYYYDTCLPMGLAISCSIFEKVSWALVWIMQNKLGASGMSHKLDDHIFTSKCQITCANNLQNFIWLCSQIGVPIKHSKTVQPTTVIEAHGVLIDSQRQEVRLPPDKLQTCKSLLTTLAQKSRCTLRELQSLIGTLQFACKAIRPGRAFLRRLINLTLGVSQPHHHIWLNKQARADINCWLLFLQEYNGTTMFLNSTWLASDTIKLFSDAAGSKGFAIVFGHRWLAGPFPQSWAQLHITIKELYPIVLAINMWGHLLANSKVMFTTDNMACVHIINTTTSRDNQVMTLVRSLVASSLKHNILFKARHIPGAHNVIPDLLSRFQFQKALTMAPWLDREPSALPPALAPGQMLT
jgi:hypothetical protein